MADPTTATCGEPADRRGFFRCGKPAGHTGDRHTADVAGGSYTWGYVPTDDDLDADNYDLDLCQPDDPGRPIVTVELPGISR